MYQYWCDSTEEWKRTAASRQMPYHKATELLVGCLTSQQHASTSQGRVCEDSCHSEIEAADQTFYLTQSQYTDSGPTSPSADLTMPGAWQGSHWYDSTRKNLVACGIRSPDLPLLMRTP